MKVIPAGTTKYLMFDAKTLERNVERSGRGAPPVVVIEVDDVGAPIGRHIGYTVTAEGPVTQAIFGRGNAMLAARNGALIARAAFATAGEVVLDREENEGKSEVPPPVAKPAAPRKPTIKKVS